MTENKDTCQHLNLRTEVKGMFRTGDLECEACGLAMTRASWAELRREQEQRKQSEP